MGGKIENFALRNILLQVTWGYTVIIITCNDLMMDQGGILQGIMGQEMLNILGTEERILGKLKEHFFRGGVEI